MIERLALRLIIKENNGTNLTEEEDGTTSFPKVILLYSQPETSVPLNPKIYPTGLFILKFTVLRRS